MTYISEFVMFPDWSPHEPNNLHQEDCMEIRSSDGKWNDSRCDSKYAFICQKAISTDVIGWAHNHLRHLVNHLDLTLQKIVIWMSKNCQKRDFFS